MTEQRLIPAVFGDRRTMGAAAADDVAAEIRRVHAERGRVRMVFAAAPSQREMLDALVAQDLPWGDIEAFHMDDYLGLDDDDPARFGNWLKAHLFERVPMGRTHLMHPDRDDAGDYAALMADAPIDITCLGIGVNGHLAFNDPPVADFDDPTPIKVVELDLDCRQQQVDDGCFSDLESVPTHAWTLTIPRLLASGSLFCVVPGAAKAAAVDRAISGPLTTDCPASALRLHRHVRLYLDRESSALLNGA